MNMKYVSICSIMKNEENYLDEWLFFHINIGIEHFYLYDNDTENKEQILKIIKKYDKYVTLYSISGKVQQLNAYNHCLSQHKNDTHWLATIDLDEFLIPNKKDDLKDAISSYEQFDGIGINWLMFGNNGHEKIDNNYSVIDRFNKCCEPDNNLDHSLESTNKFDPCCHIKTIAKPTKILSYPNPHFAIYKNNGFACDEKKNLINGSNKKIGFAGTNFVSHDFLQVNHYSVKSWEEFKKRRTQPLADSFTIPEFYKSENLRNTFEKLNYENNSVINNRAKELIKSFNNRLERI